MTLIAGRRERLSQVIDLARVYRGWTKHEMANALNRDPAKIIPESGNPKLDLVIALANALEWHVGDVAESLWTTGPDAEGDSCPFSELDLQSLVAHRAGDHAGMLHLAGRMRAVAKTGRERAVAQIRAAGALEGMGLDVRSLGCLQAALSESELSPAARIVATVNLANAHYKLWHLLEARALASDLIERYRDCPPPSKVDRAAFAGALHVRGQTSRRLVGTEVDRRRFHAAAAQADLERAAGVYSGMAVEFNDDSYNGVANTCRGAVIEAHVELGLIPAHDATTLILEGLNSVVDVENYPRGDWLESWGWWSIYGCNIAMRHFSGVSLHRFVAIFSNKAMEVADRMENWSLRERAFTMEYLRRLQSDPPTEDDEEWVLDPEDVRTLVGTMGRFPQFREIGWRMLRNAILVD